MSVTRFGVPAENVVATIDIPNSHQGMPRPARKNSAELLFRQALLQLLKNDVKKARQLLEVAIELDPQPEYIDKLRSI